MHEADHRRHQTVQVGRGSASGGGYRHSKGHRDRLQGYGRQHGHAEFYRGAEYRIDFLPKAKIELAVDDSIAEQVMEAVCNVARTGKTGDGKVWILDLEQALRVRTGETGPDAI